MDIVNLVFFAKLAGALGLGLIAWGVLVKDEIRQDMLFIIGSTGLLMYSISLMDMIFIPLQIIFILVSTWELYTLMSAKQKQLDTTDTQTEKGQK